MVTTYQYMTLFFAGGVELACSQLVRSNRHLINTAPSLMSTMMQSLTQVRGSRKLDSEGPDQLVNFAPLGTISSSCPKTMAADMLIGSATPHRRARTAAFVYHYLPGEAWMDLTVSLPCSVVLREVHIQPHVTSLASELQRTST